MLTFFPNHFSAADELESADRELQRGTSTAVVEESGKQHIPKAGANKPSQEVPFRLKVLVHNSSTFYQYLPIRLSLKRL